VAVMARGRRAEPCPGSEAPPPRWPAPRDDGHVLSSNEIILSALEQLSVDLSDVVAIDILGGDVNVFKM
jgi:hypothetical protein